VFGSCPGEIDYGQGHAPVVPQRGRAALNTTVLHTSDALRRNAPTKAAQINVPQNRRGQPAMIDSTRAAARRAAVQVAWGNHRARPHSSLCRAKFNSWDSRDPLGQRRGDRGGGGLAIFRSEEDVRCARQRWPASTEKVPVNGIGIWSVALLEPRSSWRPDL